MISSKTFQFKLFSKFILRRTEEDFTEKSQVEQSQAEGKSIAWKMGEEAQLKNINAAPSDSSNKQYSRGWKKYTDFCEEPR